MLSSTHRDTLTHTRTYTHERSWHTSRRATSRRRANMDTMIRDVMNYLTMMNHLLMDVLLAWFRVIHAFFSFFQLRGIRFCILHLEVDVVDASLANFPLYLFNSWGKNLDLNERRWSACQPKTTKERWPNHVFLFCQDFFHHFSSVLQNHFGLECTWKM